MSGVDDGEQSEFCDVKLMPLSWTPQICVRINSLPQMRNAALWAATTMSRMLPTRCCQVRILSAEVFEDVPSPDNFIQTRVHRSMRSKHIPAVDNGEQYEYGDVEAYAIDADTS